MPKSEQHMIAIEPAAMTVPTMDRPSIAFAWFLDNMGIEAQYARSDSEHETLFLVCNLCAGRVAEIEYVDNLRVLLNTALAHGC